MTFDWASVILTTVISGTANVAIWFLFKRQIDHQDQKIHDQDMELRDVRDKRLAHVEAKLEDKMSKAACMAVHSAVEKRLDQGTDDFRAMREDISIIRGEMQRMSGLLDHVLRNTGLHLINPNHGSKR